MIQTLYNLVLGGRRESRCSLQRRGKYRLNFFRLVFSEYFLVQSMRIYNIKFSIIIILSVDCSGVRYIHYVMQSSPLSGSKILPLKRNSALIKQQLATTSLPALVTAILLSVSIDFPFHVPHRAGTIQYLSFCIWLISLPFDNSLKPSWANSRMCKSREM